LGLRHQQGSVALSVATFYSRYHGLRSLEQVNPPAPVPLVIGNGQDGESYGAELTADYRATDRWRLRAGYTELRVHVWPNPGSTTHPDIMCGLHEVVRWRCRESRPRCWWYAPRC